MNVPNDWHKMSDDEKLAYLDKHDERDESPKEVKKND